jgi:hypothetical protein
LGVLAFATLLASATLAGCSGEGDHGGVGDVGSVGFRLSLPGGAMINTIDYTITGPNGFMKTASIDVAGSGSTFTAKIDGLPQGNGYMIVLTAKTTDGMTTCTGSATFNITAGQTTSVNIGLQCPGRKKTGSVMLNGTVNICAVVDSASASPMSAAVGSTIALSGAGSDEDSLPSPITYKWTTTGGTLAGDTTASATLTCTTAGSFVVSLTVSDTDCGDKVDVNVTCTSGGAGGSGGAGIGGAGAGGAGAGGAGAGGAGAGGAGAGGAGAGGAGAGGAGAGGAGAGGAGAGGAGAGGAGAGGSGPDACTVCEMGAAITAMRLTACDTATGTVNGVAKSDLCHQVLSCIRTSKCASAGVNDSASDCVCGTDVDVGVCAGQTLDVVSGACKTIIATGAESMLMTDISNRLGDATYATGLAIQLIQADQVFCPTECSF